MPIAEPAARGLGIGARLVEGCRICARSAGYARMPPRANSSLASARRLYEAAGPRLVKSEPHLVAETWELGLQPGSKSHAAPR